MTDKQASSESHTDRPISELYQSTRNEEPGNELDARILAQARKASRTQRRRWLLPLSSAAVILLGLTLTLRLVDQPPLLPQMEEVLSEEPAYDAKPAHQLKKSVPKPSTKSNSEFFSSRRESKSEGRQRMMAPAKPLPLGRLESMPSSESLDQERSPFVTDDPFTLLEQEQVESPENWLEEIEAMIAAGEYTKAAHSLEAFRRQYPNYPLPEFQVELNLD